MIFGLFKNKKKYPLLKLEMIEPKDEPITTSEAKKLFKQYMLQIGYLEKEELSEHASYLVNEINENEQYLKDDIADKKKEIKEKTEILKTLKIKFNQCTDEDGRDDIESEIEDCSYDIDFLKNELDKIDKELADFQSDKKTFLVDYINNQIKE